MSEEIADLIIRQFNLLKKSGKPKDHEFTILSGIVLESPNGKECIAIGMGMRCLHPRQMSDRGDVLNDCHAEILAKRAFRSYLLNQMENALSGNHSILEYAHDEDRPFRLKSNHVFHLYISQAPCNFLVC